MVLRWELKKILASPAILGVALLFVLINGLIICVTPQPTWEDDQSQTMTNIYDGFDASAIGDGYIARYGLTGHTAERVRTLYGELQESVDAKAVAGDAMSPYLGERTAYVHEFLYGTVFPIALGEACVLGLVIGLLTIDYDRARATEQVIWSSTVGRRIWGWKLAAALIGSMVTAVVILGVTLLVFCWRFHYGGVWSDQVSSGFNMAVGEMGKPFITWDRLTVADYLVASVGVGFGVVVCWVGLGIALGSLIRNSYAAITAAVLLVATSFLVPFRLPIASLAKQATLLTPLQLILTTEGWFTDGGADIVVSHFETVGLVACLAVSVGLLVCAGLRVRKVNLT